MYIDKLKNTRTVLLPEEFLQNTPQNMVIHNYQTVINDEETKIIANVTTYNILIGYDKIVEGLIKDKYSIEQELCLTNKGIKDATNTEYVEYRNYVEQCKINARAFIEERYNAIGK